MFSSWVKDQFVPVSLSSLWVYKVCCFSWILLFKEELVIRAFHSGAVFGGGQIWQWVGQCCADSPGNKGENQPQQQPRRSKNKNRDFLIGNSCVTQEEKKEFIFYLFVQERKKLSSLVFYRFVSHLVWYFSYISQNSSSLKETSSWNHQMNLRKQASTLFTSRCSASRAFRSMRDWYKLQFFTCPPGAHCDDITQPEDHLSLRLRYSSSVTFSRCKSKCHRFEQQNNRKVLMKFLMKEVLIYSWTLEFLGQSQCRWNNRRLCFCLLGKKTVNGEMCQVDQLFFPDRSHDTGFKLNYLLLIQ